MNKIKRTNLRDRAKAAWLAFRGKPVSRLSFGIEVKRCDDCRRSGHDVEGCYFCEDAGVQRIAPFGRVDGLGILKPRYCFNCGKRLLVTPEDAEEVEA